MLTKHRMEQLHNMVECQSDGIESYTSFWFSLHRKKEIAEKLIKELNQLFIGTKATAKLGFARNYNDNGCDWGVFICDFNSLKDNYVIARKYDGELRSEE